MSFQSPSAQLRTRLKVQKAALRNTIHKGVSVGKKTPMKIMTGHGTASRPTMGYASKSPYSVTKPLNKSLGPKSKGKLPRATGYR